MRRVELCGARPRRCGGVEESLFVAQKTPRGEIPRLGASHYALRTQLGMTTKMARCAG